MENVGQVGMAEGRLRSGLRMPWVVLLGTDGSGKSSVARALKETFPPPWAGRLKMLYRRPALLDRSANPAGVPVFHHSQPPHGAAISVLKLGFRLLEWLAGYWARAVYWRARGYLVVLDRHYLLDLAVSPRRYRYGGPLWLLNGVQRVMPRPDLIILLDAPVEVLRARKQELPVEETVRQKAVYLELVQNLPGGHRVDASRPLEQVVADVQKIILGYLGSPASGREAKQVTNSL